MQTFSSNSDALPAVTGMVFILLHVVLSFDTSMDSVPAWSEYAYAQNFRIVFVAPASLLVPVKVALAPKLVTLSL